jgi:multicomponent Na+:H+ antiporter subunit D
MSLTWESALPLGVLLSSLVTGLAIFGLKERQARLRTALNLGGAVVKLVLILAIFEGVLRGVQFEARLRMLPGIDLLLRVDPISLLFVALSGVLWLLTTVYAVGYLEGSPNRSRFFGFFSLCVTATMGIALAGNLLTFLVFYEALTLATYPLVVHRGTREARAAGAVYLSYTLMGGAVLLLAVVWLHALAGPAEFTGGGTLGERDLPALPLTIIFFLMMAGLGVKAALVPLHGWLPRAMVAPAPVSALLHAVAVVKAGVYGIIRVVYDLYGIEFAYALGVLGPLSAVAAFTILYGSIKALQQTDLKRRLAYSTVSQVAYIVLGASVVGPVATAGGLVHLVHQGIMKVTLFFCAGNLSETLGIKRVDQMRGAGRRMPFTMAAFTLAAFGMVGVPPLAGFVSKWYLGFGGVVAGEPWVLVVLIASGVLNAIYFLPLVHAAWFLEPDGSWRDVGPPARAETRWTLLIPPVVTAALSLAFGLLAGLPNSPIDLARRIAAGLYLP